MRTRTALRSGPTISDVAAAAGVNKTTASVVLNGNRSGTRVSEATRARIQRAASDLGYQANAVARGLAQGRMNVLGVIFSGFSVTFVSNYYAGGVLEGVMWVASGVNYNVLLFTKGPEEVMTSPSFVRDRRADGYIVVDPKIDSPVTKTLASTGLPLVALASRAEDHGVPAVDVDNVHGGRLAMEHLLSLGHTRIAHIAGPLDQHASIARYETYRGMLQEAGIAARPEYLVETNFQEGTDYALARRLLTLPEPPTAILATIDLSAYEVLQAARDLGVSVPQELSVVGFDDMTASRHVVPPLTSVRQPITDIGDRATRMLLSLIEGETVPVDTTLVAPELVIRQSTALVR